MVAVALLPLAATLGPMLVKVTQPRVWFKKKKAKRATVVYVPKWIIALLILMVFIYAHRFII